MMGIVCVLCEAPKVMPLPWEALRVIAGPSPMVPANSPYPFNWVLRVSVVLVSDSFLQRMLHSISGTLAPAMSRRVGLHAWKTNPGLKKEDSKKKPTVLSSHGGADRKSEILRIVGNRFHTRQNVWWLLLSECNPQTLHQNVASFGTDRSKYTHENLCYFESSGYLLALFAHQEWYFPGFFFCGM